MALEIQFWSLRDIGSLKLMFVVVSASTFVIVDVHSKGEVIREKVKGKILNLGNRNH